MKKIAIITVVLCLVSAGMLSGCVNPLDPKEQFIGIWELASVEPASDSDFQVLWIFSRDGTLEMRYLLHGVPIESYFGSYQVKSESIIEMTMDSDTTTIMYNFLGTNILTLLCGGLLYTFNKVS